MSTPTTGTEYRQSGYSAFYTGHIVPVEFTFYLGKRAAQTPIVLSQYDGGLFLGFYDASSDSVLRQKVALTVLDDADDLVDDVACRASADVLATGSPGDVVCKLVGVKSGVFCILDKPWKATVFRGGPTGV